jgi:hypothetical protein
MGKTWVNTSKKFEDDASGRSGKHAKHSNGKKTKGMKTLNSYVEEDYDPFEDDIELNDEILIQHTKQS